MAAERIIEELKGEEKWRYQCGTTEELTDEQYAEWKDMRIGQELIDAQEEALGIGSTYIVRPLPGKTNDEKWICLKGHFIDGVNSMNMLLGSTSGIHGSSTTLNDLEDETHLAELAEEGMCRSDDEAFTILILQPRVCRLTWGTVGIRDDEDIRWLRQTITDSLMALIKSQEGNMKK